MARFKWVGQSGEGTAAMIACFLFCFGQPVDLVPRHVFPVACS